MGDKTAISWTQHTMNFWTGCTKISPGCDHCYMFTAQERYGRTPDMVIRTSPALWKKPYSWNSEAQAEGLTRRVFTCSWSDFFHKDSDPWRGEAWKVVRETPWLHYQILTKRPGRIPYSLPGDWGDGYSNVWLGVSIESPEFLWRLETLRKVPARVRFLSIEPLLENVGELDLTGIHLVIVGGESGPGFRPMRHSWAREIRDKCVAQGVAFFFKQSAAPRTEMGTALEEEDGSRWIWQQYPGSLDPPRRISKPVEKAN